MSKCTNLLRPRLITWCIGWLSLTERVVILAFRHLTEQKTQEQPDTKSTTGDKQSETPRRCNLESPHLGVHSTIEYGSLQQFIAAISIVGRTKHQTREYEM